jgi:hypothetical protein
MEIRREIGRAANPGAPGAIDFSDDHAAVWLIGGDRIEVEREPLVVRFTTREPLSVDAVLHPYLGLPAALASHWLGRITLHGGAFVYGGRGWGLLGQREAGKSALLSQMFLLGHDVLADDVLVIDGTTVYAGPRSIDLREEAAGVIGGEALGVIGARPRWRLRPPASEPSVPLGGFLLLEWGESMIEELDLGARLEALSANSALGRVPDSGAGMLDLIALPAWRFRRPAVIDQLDEQAAQLLALIDARFASQAD